MLLKIVRYENVLFNGGPMLARTIIAKAQDIDTIKALGKAPFVANSPILSCDPDRVKMLVEVTSTISFGSVVTYQSCPLVVDHHPGSPMWLLPC
jgi:hypothetical protein